MEFPLPGAADANPLLSISLSAAVPLNIARIREWTPEARMAEAQKAATMIASHGDDLLYGGPKCAEAFNALALGLACLAFVPGGVTLFGETWTA